MSGPVIVRVGGELDRHGAEALGIELLRLARRYGVEPGRVYVEKTSGKPEAGALPAPASTPGGPAASSSRGPGHPQPIDA